MSVPIECAANLDYFLEKRSLVRLVTAAMTAHELVPVVMQMQTFWSVLVWLWTVKAALTA